MKATFGQADPVKGLGAGGDHADGVGVGQADVLPGKDQHAAKEKAGILAGIDHLGQPVEGSVGIRAAQRLDEGADGVIVVVAVLVVKHRPALDALLGHGHIDHDPAVLAGWGGLDGQLQGVQHPPRVAVGHVDQVGQRVVVELDVEAAIAPLGIGQGVAGNGLQIGLAQGAELEDAAAADQGPVDAKVGVLGGGADEDDRAVLHPGQEGVLLGFVPAVDLVDKEDGPLAVERPPLLGLLGHAAYIGHAGQDRVQRLKVAAGGVGDDGGQGRLARAGRPVKDDRRELVGLDGAAQQAAGPDDVFLADEFVEGAGAQAGGQRRFAGDLILAGVLE